MRRSAIKVANFRQNKNIDPYPQKWNFDPQHKFNLRAIGIAYLGSNYVRKAQPEKVHWARMPPVLLFPICFIRFWNFTQDLDDDDAKKN
jgi:hypothetical protein